MKRLLIALFSLLCIGSVSADYITVRRDMFLKQEPKNDSVLIRKLSVGERLELQDDSQQINGYYFISTEDGHEGYVYRTVGRVIRSEANVIQDTRNDDGEPIATSSLRECGRHLLFGIPLEADQILCREGYAVGYSYDDKIPVWISYSITRDQVRIIGGKRPGFTQDRELPKEFRSKNSDYVNTGYDRGHMAPNASMDFTLSSQKQSFLYSNITPQLPAFNRDMHGYTGAWGRLEKYERQWIETRGELIVIMGVYLGPNYGTIGQGVAIPTHFYRIAIDPATLETIAFWMPQDKNTGDKLIDYLVSIDYIESVTRADLLSKITPDIQEMIEAKKQLSLW